MRLIFLETVCDATFPVFTTRVISTNISAGLYRQYGVTVSKLSSWLCKCLYCKWREQFEHVCRWTSSGRGRTVSALILPRDTRVWERSSIPKTLWNYKCVKLVMLVTLHVQLQLSVNIQPHVCTTVKHGKKTFRLISANSLNMNKIRHTARNKGVEYYILAFMNQLPEFFNKQEWKRDQMWYIKSYKMGIFYKLGSMVV